MPIFPSQIEHYNELRADPGAGPGSDSGAGHPCGPPAAPGQIC